MPAAGAEQADQAGGRAEQAADRQRRSEAGGEAPVEGDHGPQAGGGGDAEQAGIGERIAQRALQDRSGQAKGAADQQREEGAGEADLGEDQGVGWTDEAVADQQGRGGDEGEEEGEADGGGHGVGVRRWAGGEGLYHRDRCTTVG